MDQQNNPSVPGSEPENGHPQPVIRPVDESGQPGAGWGAPQQPVNQQPVAGWGAPQQPVNQQPAAGWGAPQQSNAGQPRPSFFKNWSLKKGLIVGGVRRDSRGFRRTLGFGKRQDAAERQVKTQVERLSRLLLVACEAVHDPRHAQVD